MIKQRISIDYIFTVPTCKKILTFSSFRQEPTAGCLSIKDKCKAIATASATMYLKAHLPVLVTAWASSIFAQNQNCSLSFDGRIPQIFTPQTFDTNSSLFNTQAAKGESACLDLASPLTTPISN